MEPNDECVETSRCVGEHAREVNHIRSWQSRGTHDVAGLNECGLGAGTDGGHTAYLATVHRVSYCSTWIPITATWRFLAGAKPHLPHLWRANLVVLARISSYR
jgi:hypothetical protein